MCPGKADGGPGQSPTASQQEAAKGQRDKAVAKYKRDEQDNLKSSTVKEQDN